MEPRGMTFSVATTQRTGLMGQRVARVAVDLGIRPDFHNGNDPLISAGPGRGDGEGNANS